MTQFSPARLILIALLACMALGLVACGSTPEKPSLNVSITASADVNPDLESRASPVILHILELTAIDEFNRADYFSLTQDDASALGVDVLNKTEIILTPGSQKSLTTVVVEDMGQQSGSLNPQWIEWLMGYPAGWTDLGDSETQSSRRSSRKSAGQ